MTDKIIKQNFDAQEVSDQGEFRVQLVTLGLLNKNGYIWSENVKLQSDQVLLSPFDHQLLAQGGFFGGDVMVPPPVGAGRIKQEAGYLYLEGKYNLKTQAGKEAYERALFLYENNFNDPWSIGFYPHEVEMVEQSDGEEVPVVMSAEPIEASPVTAGADQNAHMVTLQNYKDKKRKKKKQESRYLWLPGIKEVIKYE